MPDETEKEEIESSEDVAIREFYELIEPITDEKELANMDLRRGAQVTLVWVNRGLRLLAQYPGNRNMALDAYLIAIGQGDMIGMHTAVEVAVKHYGDPKKKWTVGKVVQMFRDCLQITGMPGQRPENGKLNMAKARKKQLKTK